MSRRITASLLAIGLLGSLGLCTLASIARAAEWTPADDTDTGGGATTTTTTAAPPAAAPVKRLLPTIESIEKLLDKGKAVQAEMAYLEWAHAWQEDVPDLFIRIETAILNDEFKAGDESAFVALLSAGEPTARQQFREGKVTLKGDMQVAAIRALGAHGTSADITFLVNQLKSANHNIVGAAIEALGNIGSTRSLPALHECARTANLANSMLLGQAFMKIGGPALVKERYTKQITFPFYYPSKRACMILALAGVNAHWPFMKSVLDNKKDITPDDNPNKYYDATPPSFYPLILSVIGNLKTDEADAYVKVALKDGTAAEKAAAVKSIDVLGDGADAALRALILTEEPAVKDADEEDDPFAEADALKKPLTLNAETPAVVRLSAIACLSDRYSDGAQTLLRQLATSLTITDTDAMRAAILAAEQNGLLSDEQFRLLMHVQVMRPDPAIVRSARTALLAGTLNGM